jgi:hypothetical protein
VSGGADRNATILTAGTRCLQQHENLLIIEMLEAVDVVDDGWSEEALAGQTRRGRGGLGETAQWHRGLRGAARALEGIAVLRGAVLEELGFIVVHGIVVRA